MKLSLMFVAASLVAVSSFAAFAAAPASNQLGTLETPHASSIAVWESDSQNETAMAVLMPEITIVASVPQAKQHADWTCGDWQPLQQGSGFFKACN